jgi:hypothetical protein
LRLYLLHTNSLNSAIRCDDDCFHWYGCPSEDHYALIV